MRFPPVCVDHLRHAYGKHKVYEDLSLSFEMGKIYGLLGKNGVGKTTLIKIIMGFLKPLGGSCRIFGDPAHAIRPATRERVGLLFERHLAYDFFTIAQVERFMAAFYPRWKAERYHALVDVLGLPSTHRIAHMSEGQRSQVVLGLMLAQDPDLLVLDDYLMPVTGVSLWTACANFCVTGGIRSSLRPMSSRTWTDLWMKPSFSGAAAMP